MPSIDALLGIEGVTAAAYWRSWHGVPVKWKALSRRPIPSDWHQVGPRQSARNPKNHLASHPVHAMLNYGYALLESHVRIRIAAEGLNPTLGVLHRARRDVMPLCSILWSRYGPSLIRRCFGW